MKPRDAWIYMTDTGNGAKTTSGILCFPVDGVIECFVDDQSDEVVHCNRPEFLHRFKGSRFVELS